MKHSITIAEVKDISAKVAYRAAIVVLVVFCCAVAFIGGAAIAHIWAGINDQPASAGHVPVIALYTESNYGDTLTINEMIIHQTADSVEVLVQWVAGAPHQRMEWGSPVPGSRIVHLRPVMRTHSAVPRYTLGIPIDRKDSLEAVKRGWTITTSVTHHREGRRSEDLWAYKSFEW